jgi:arylsulfatase A-like enzyme
MTDDFGYQIVENPVHVNDFHATMLHLLGVNHEKLTFPSQGRDYRLTDVGGKLVKGILA